MACNIFTRVAVAAFMIASPLSAAQAGGGDLLVAPTRVVLDGSRSTEVILNNIGSEPATYRISLELRRMTPEGEIIEIPLENASDSENAALGMITYAPRKVVLAPNQPQSIRIGIRPPAGLPDGEYRVHMLFRAIPETVSVTAPVETNGVSIALTPIYGITIPIIVRQGKLQATAALSDVHVEKTAEGPVLTMNLSRTGDRSVYGQIRIMKPGRSEPVMQFNGLAVYPEIAGRAIKIPLSPEALNALAGPIEVQFLEDRGDGALVKAAEASAVIR